MGRDRDLVGRRKDGTEFPIEVMLSAMTREGGPTVVAADTPVHFSLHSSRGSQKEMRLLSFTVGTEIFDAIHLYEKLGFKTRCIINFAIVKESKLWN